MNIYSDYDGFAAVYNRHWAPHEGGKAVPRLKKLFLDSLPPGSKILDLCCGSGHLLQHLSDHGYLVTGLDGSSELLKYARVNAPDAELVLADARTFQLSSSYDAVACISDSLNHIMSLPELKQVFENVHSALKKNGVFHFDLNREHKYRHRWSGSFAFVDDEEVCAVVATVDEEKKVAALDATIFERREGWDRHDVTLLQTWYSEPEVVGTLTETGFADVVLSYSNKDDPEAADKVYVVCRKRGN